MAAQDAGAIYQNALQGINAAVIYAHRLGEERTTNAIIYGMLPPNGFPKEHTDWPSKLSFQQKCLLAASLAANHHLGYSFGHKHAQMGRNILEGR